MLELKIRKVDLENKSRIQDNNRRVRERVKVNLS